MAKRPVVVKAREEFKAWWKSFKLEKHYPQGSYQQEFNFQADRQGQIHHHVVISRLFVEEKKRVRIFSDRDWKQWYYKGVPPDCTPCLARGRHAMKSVHNLHGYLQATFIKARVAIWYDRELRDMKIWVLSQ